MMSGVNRPGQGTWRLCAIGAAVAATLGVAGAARADVSVGVLIPSSGKGASYGQQQQTAIDMFMDKYSDLGGKAGKLKLVTYDTRGENTDAINLTRKLIDSDKVVAIVGPQFSGESEVSFPLAVRGETPMVTPMAAKAGITAANRPWTFRFALTSGNAYGPLLDDWLKRRGPIKKVVVMMDGKDAVSAFDGKTVFPGLLKARGVEVLDTISFQTGDIDYSAQVTRAKSLPADGIIVSALYNEAAHVVQEIRKQGMKQPIVGGVGINDPRFIQLGGEATQGVMAASDFFAGNPKPAVADWANEFEKRFKQRPSNAAGEMYDTLYLMRQCILKTGVTGASLKADRTKLRDCWANMKNETAPLMGATSMDKDGDATRIPAILEVKGTGFATVQ
jgi:branched-chain amino acid transport system substrate-binding protein